MPAVWAPQRRFAAAPCQSELVRAGHLLNSEGEGRQLSAAGTITAGGRGGHLSTEYPRYTTGMECRQNHGESFFFLHPGVFVQKGSLCEFTFKLFCCVEATTKMTTQTACGGIKHSLAIFVQIS